MGIRAESLALSRKIDDIWTEKVEPAFEQARVLDQVVDAQAERGRQLARQIDLECEQKEMEIFAEVADRVLAAARAVLAKGFACKQCHAQIPIPKQVFRSTHVTCSFCSASNTFEPGTQVRMTEGFCAHYLSQRAALREWTELKEAEERRRRARGEPPEVMQALREATRRYWTAYYTHRATLVPEYSKDLQRDIDSRLRSV